MKLEKLIEKLFFPSNVAIVLSLLLILYLIENPFTLNHFLILLTSSIIFFVGFGFTKKLKSETKRFSYPSSLAMVVFLILLYFIPVSREFLFGGICLFLVNFIVHFIRDIWKISAHVMVYTTASMAFSIININFILLFVLLPLIIWSKIKLKKHTISQIFVGFLLGIIIPIVMDYILLSLL